MAITVTVPRLGWSMEEGTFVEWLKADGDEVTPGEPLFVLESDKATENIESLDAGILRIPPDSPQPGTTVKVGQVLAYLTTADATAPPAAATPPPVPGDDVRGAGFQPATVGQAGSLPHGPAISPRARRVGRELNVDWSGLEGSGRTGRIRERDIRAAASGGATPGPVASGAVPFAAAEPAPPGRLIPHTRVRRLIAARMVAGVTQAAPVTLTTKVDATLLVALRDRFLERIKPGDAVPAPTDLLLKLTARALRQHPLLVGQWRDDGIFVPDDIHLAFAVDVEAGLLAPVVRDADKLTLEEIARRRRELTAQARAGTLAPRDMQGATFTLSNLGMFGIDAFTPIIHLPQCAVLGVGRIVREPAVVEDRIVPRDLLTLSLTFDHRVVDGAPAARFLDALRRAIERPEVD